MEYTKESWKNVSDPSNPGDGSIPISAEIMDKIEQGLVDTSQEFIDVYEEIETNDSKINDKVDTLRFKLTAEFKEAGTYTWTPSKSQCTAIVVVIAGGDGGDGGVSQSNHNYGYRPGYGGNGGAAIVSSVMTLEEGVEVPIVVGKGGIGGKGWKTSSENFYKYLDEKGVVGGKGESSSFAGLTVSNDVIYPLCGTRYGQPSIEKESDGINPLHYTRLALTASGTNGASEDYDFYKNGSYDNYSYVQPKTALNSFLGSGGIGGTKDTTGTSGSNGCGGGGGYACHGKDDNGTTYAGGDGGNGGDGYVAIYTLGGTEE